MENSKKEELLTLFTVALALIAISALIYISRTPSLAGNAVLNELDPSFSVPIIFLLIIFGISAVIGAILSIHKLQKELEQHKDALAQNKTIILEHPNIDIVKYVMDARRSGFSDAQITRKLKESGWTKEEIKKYL